MRWRLSTLQKLMAAPEISEKRKAVTTKDTKDTKKSQSQAFFIFVLFVVKSCSSSCLHR